jgi:hypothetical protein
MPKGLSIDGSWRVWRKSAGPDDILEEPEEEVSKLCSNRGSATGLQEETRSLRGRKRGWVSRDEERCILVF